MYKYVFCAVELSVCSFIPNPTVLPVIQCGRSAVGDWTSPRNHGSVMPSSIDRCDGILGKSQGATGSNMKSSVSRSSPCSATIQGSYIPPRQLNNSTIQNTGHAEAMRASPSSYSTDLDAEISLPTGDNTASRFALDAIAIVDSTLHFVWPLLPP